MELLKKPKNYCIYMDDRKTVSINGDHCATPVKIFKGKGNALIGNGIEKMYLYAIVHAMIMKITNI